MKKSLISHKWVKKVDPSKFEFLGEKFLEDSSIQIFNFNTDEISEYQDFDDTENLDKYFPDERTTWLNVYGLHDVELISDICRRIKLHNFIIQEILDTNQRPKLIETENYIYISANSLLPSTDNSMGSELISFILGEDYILSFQEKHSDHFDHIRKRLRQNIGLVRSRGADFLLFLLLESIVDNIYQTKDKLITAIDSYLNDKKNEEISHIDIIKIEEYKEDLNFINKKTFPMKDSLNLLQKQNPEIIKELNLKYYSLLEEKCKQIIEDIDWNLQILDSKINLFISYQGFKMNNIMKVLTLVATIFIPLTFIAGVYGMNFDYMPELKWTFGYFAVLGIMLICAIVMLIFFKIKKWI